MAILFRPSVPIDQEYWAPALRDAFAGDDLRIAPDTGDASDIEFLIAWKLEEGDKTRWPSLKALLSLSAGVNQYVGHPELPDDIRLIRMLDPGLMAGMCEYVASFVYRFHREHDALAAERADVEWSSRIPKLASDRSVGFLGLGTLGQACANALRPAGFRLRGWGRSEKQVDGVESFHGPAGLGPFLGGTDILVNLLPLTPETEDIIDAKLLRQLPRGACLINAARGKHVVDADLIAALDDGQIAMAALDVFRKEPLPADHPFWTHPKILITPHLAAVTTPRTAIPVLKENIAMLRAGKTPAGQVDLSRGY